MFSSRGFHFRARRLVNESARAYFCVSDELTLPSPRVGSSSRSRWDGSQAVFNFGCPNTTTYGQVITVPEGMSALDKFTFAWTNHATTGSTRVRGEVYAWDGSKATGSALFESGPRLVSFTDSLFHFEAFKPGGVSVTAGSQYVIFASIDKNFRRCTDNYTLGWAAVNDSVYAGGTFVFQNNTGDETQWTTTQWYTFGIDLAFKRS